MPDIAIWNKCNNHCVMCTNSSAFQLDDSIPYSFKNIKERWGTLQLKPSDTISLTGGEPTIHPDFIKIARWFRKQYPNNKLVIASNGRMFYYITFIKNLLKINDLLLEIAIHGFDENSHDSITRVKGSFKQTIEGIHNILRYKNESQELEIRIIITKLTYKNLDKILSFIKNEFDINQIRDIVLIFMEMEGQVKDNFKSVGITYKEVMKYLPQVVNKWASHFHDFRLYHFPLCVLPLQLWPYAWRTLRGEEVIFLSKCNKCFFQKYCLGIHRDYSLLIGNKEFKPLKRRQVKLSNSFYHPIDKVFDA